MTKTGYLRIGSIVLLAAVAAGVTVAGITGAQEEERKVTIKGKVVGGEALLNPVWLEAKDPKNHRYTFRTPSPTVGSDVKNLTSYLPKELCIVALSSSAKSSKDLFEMTVSGGRTTPVTMVIPEGATVKIVNHDPFPHQIYTVDQVGGLVPGDIEPTKDRQWTPPKVGKYELRDQVAPSVRSWIVVEPKVTVVDCVGEKDKKCSCGHPNLKNEFLMSGLPSGEYLLRGYHNGEAVGKDLPIEVRDNPAEQEIRDPLVVGKVEKKKGE